MRRRSLVVGICSITLFGACQFEASEPTDTEEFSAVVEDFPEAPIAPGTIARVLVSHPVQPEPADRSIVHITPSTIIVRRLPTGKTVPASVEEIEVGRSAVFQVENIELRSDPRQVFATRIEL